MTTGTRDIYVVNYQKRGEHVGKVPRVYAYSRSIAATSRQDAIKQVRREQAVVGVQIHIIGSYYYYTHNGG